MNLYDDYIKTQMDNGYKGVKGLGLLFSVIWGIQLAKKYLAPQSTQA